MTMVRQDAWSTNDDLILAEVTLKHIREGSTQLAAFEEVGEKIGRTSAACGFRWNSYVRKQHEEAIQICKQQRQKRSYFKRQTFSETSHISSIRFVEEEDPLLLEQGEQDHDDTLSIDRVIRFLRQWKTSHYELIRQLKATEKELRYKSEELSRLREQNEKLVADVNHVQTDYHLMNDDYKTLIQIMDRARRLTVLGEEDEYRPRFKMDANGNLERIESSATIK